MNKIKFISSIFCASALSLGVAQAHDFEGSSAAFELVDLDGSDVRAELVTDESMSGSQSLKLIDQSSTSKPFASFAFANGPADEGKVSVQVFVPKGNAKSTYIAIGQGVTVDGVERYLEVQSTGSGKVKFEAGKSDPVIGQIQRDTWNQFVIEWAEGSFSLEINGELIEDGLPIVNPDFVPTNVVLYTGDNKSTGNTAYFDDLKSDLF